MAVRRTISNLVQRNPGEVAIESDLELYRNISARDLDTVRSRSSRITVPTGRRLGRAGRLCQNFVVVLDGQVGVSVRGKPIGVLPAGTFFGELPLLSPLGEQRYHVDTTALSSTTLAVSTPSEFSALMMDVSLLAERIRAVCDLRRRYLKEMEDDLAAWIQEEHDDFPAHLEGSIA